MSYDPYFNSRQPNGESFNPFDDPGNLNIGWLLDYLQNPEPSAAHESRESGNYQIFTSREERQELYTIGRRIAEYAVNNNIGTVCFLDRSARPAYVAMREFWRVQYPDIPVPKINFLNPKGFVAVEDINSGRVDLDELMYNDRYKEGNVESPRNIRYRQTIVNEIKAAMPKDDEPQRPIMVFDACIHTGNSIKPVLDKLYRAGVEDVRFGVVSPRNNSSGIRPDFTVMDKVPVGVCYPFDRDTLTKKVYGSITAARNTNVYSLQDGRVLRDEIRRSIQEFLPKN